MHQAGRRNVEHKHTIRAKQEIHLEHNIVVEKQNKLRRAETEIEQLKHQLEEGPKLSVPQKLQQLRELLLDEDIFKTLDFADIVASALRTPAPTGCPNSAKDKVLEALLPLACTRKAKAHECSILSVFSQVFGVFVFFVLVREAVLILLT